MKEQETNSLEEQIKLMSKKFLEISENKDIQIISHFDTDGITSAAIMLKTIKKLDKTFSVKIIKNLEEEFIYNLPKNKLTLFLDLASGSLHHISNSDLENVFIIDHHEIVQEIPEKINIVNPELHDKRKMSSSCLTYLFCREIDKENKELAKLAVLGMIGDMLEKEIDSLNNEILHDSEIEKRKGLLIYPSTRPLNRTLEFCSNPYIPKITGNPEGVLELLRESGLTPVNKKYKSLIELNQEEMKKLVTAIMLRNPKSNSSEMVGNIFLIKLFNKIEDAREFSAMVNACSRLGDTKTALMLCMEIQKAKKKAEEIHAKYKQLIVSGLKFALETEKIKGNGFVIINAGDEIKDTMVGTIASILSNSPLYEKGTIIVTMAYYNDKIKVSARNVARTGRNAREVLSRVIEAIGGEVGGHEFAAGCLINRKNEQEFIKLLKKNLEIEVVRV